MASDTVKVDLVNMITNRTEPLQVAHGFNEELTIILNSASVAARLLGPDHPAHQVIAELNRSARRCADLSRKLENQGQTTQSPISSPASY